MIYNITFVQLGLTDLGERIIGLSKASVATQMAYLALLTCAIALEVGYLMKKLGAIPFALILGRWTAQQLKWKLTRAGKSAVGMLLLVCISELSQLIPWAGSLAVLALMMVGFGAVLLTCFGLRRYTPPVDIWESETESYA